MLRPVMAQGPIFVEQILSSHLLLSYMQLFASQLTCLLLQIERGNARRLARFEDNLPERESVRQLRAALPRRGQEHEAADVGRPVLL